MPLSDTQAAFIASLRNPALPPPASLSSPEGVLPKKRFDVYRNNMAASLIEALRASFPIVERLVGEEFFKATARAYIDHEPPRSPLLFLYGQTLGDFLEGFPPAESVPYLSDIARLEWSRLTAYHAADQAPVTIDALAQVPPEQLGDVTFQFHPSLALLSSRWPVFSIWAASSGLASEDAVEMGRAEELAVIRPAFEVDTRLLPKGGYSFIHALQGGATLGQAAELAATTTDGFELAQHLEGLFHLGAVTGISNRKTND